jgi:hypothetical protein
MPGFSAVASTPIAALPTAVNSPKTVVVAGVFGTATLGAVTPAISSPVLASGFMLGFGPVASSPVAAIVTASAGGGLVTAQGVSCTASLGLTTVYIPDSPVVLLVDGVYCFVSLGSVIVSTIPVINLVGVYATVRLGDVLVRTYTPTRWIPIDTSGGHVPNWQPIST